MRSLVKYACAVLGALCVIATAFPFLELRVWWVRGLDFPRLQIGALLLVLAVTYGWMLRPRRWWGELALLALMTAALGVQVHAIVPYTPLVAVQASGAADPEAERLTLLIANVLQDNQDSDRLRERIAAEQPDVILLLEVNQRWCDALQALERDYPHRLLHPLDNTYGIALYSRLELRDAHLLARIEPDIPAIDAVVVLRGGAEVQLHGVHPEPPAPGENVRSTERDAELVLVGSAAERATRPVIVAGDMNDVAWSPTTRRFQRISGLLDPRVGRGLFSTYNAQIPLLRWPLDHVFFSADFRLVDLRRLEAIGSDHFPILITLSHEPERDDGHAPIPDADHEDRAEAREVVREAREGAPQE